MEQIFESVKEIEKELAPYLSSDEKTAEFLMIENAAASLDFEKNPGGKSNFIFRNTVLLFFVYAKTSMEVVLKGVKSLWLG